MPVTLIRFLTGKFWYVAQRGAYLSGRAVWLNELSSLARSLGPENEVPM
jgi:hypothetical protein